MNENVSFKGYSIVSCGSMQVELGYLKEQNFLDADKILFTAPGLHEKQKDLEQQLVKQLATARKYSEKAIVLFGERCFLDFNDPKRNVDAIVLENGPGVSRIKARTCFDMLASEEEREQIRDGRKVYWLTPGWVRNWKTIFSTWSDVMANETFPGNATALVLDAFGDFDKIMEEEPEKILEFSDWMKIAIEPVTISPDRLKTLLINELSG